MGESDAISVAKFLLPHRARLAELAVSDGRRCAPSSRSCMNCQCECTRLDEGGGEPSDGENILE